MPEHGARRITAGSCSGRFCDNTDVLLLLFLFLCQMHAATRPVTFTRDIAPILYRNCAVCHRAGEVAPFPLLTYSDAAKRVALIAQVTSSRYMPPWKPESGHGEFVSARAD